MKLCLIANCALLVCLCRRFLIHGLGMEMPAMPAMPVMSSGPPSSSGSPGPIETSGGVFGQLRDMVLFFLFGLFTYQFELYSKLSDFDFTSDLKYIY
jgi:hypothetical protein